MVKFRLGFNWFNSVFCIELLIRYNLCFVVVNIDLSFCNKVVCLFKVIVVVVSRLVFWMVFGMFD